MEDKKADGICGSYGGLFGNEHVKIPLISDGEDRRSHSSRSSSGSPKRQQKFSSDREGSRDGRDRKDHQPSGESLSKKTRPIFRHRKSSGSSSEDEKSTEQNFDGKKMLPDKDSENAEKTLYPWHAQSISFRLKGNLPGAGQSSDSIKQPSSEIKEMRLSQLSSERDRSISVDRSSSSSEGRVSIPKKSSTSLQSQSSERRNSPKSPSKDTEIKANNKEYSTSKTSSDSSRTKDLDRRANDRKKSSSDEKYRSKQSRSRSRSRSINSYKKRGSSPRRDRHRSRDRYRNRSPRRSPRPKSRRSRSRGHRSRSPGYRSRSRGYRSRDHRSRSRDRHRRSRSYEKRRYRRERSSSRDRHRKRRRSHSSSRSRSRGRSSRDRSKGRAGLSVSKVGSLPLSTTSGAMTPQMALQQTMAAMSAKAQALTGIELPKYYNPAAVNPLKYAEQVQKRKLLWQSKKETTEEQSKNTVWDKLTFSQDQDGKMTAKFRKLMGIKNEAENAAAEVETKETVMEGNSDPGTLQKQEELFRNLDQQYEMARMSTHTHRGVGLGYSSQAIFPPLQKP